MPNLNAKTPEEESLALILTVAVLTVVLSTNSITGLLSTKDGGVISTFNESESIDAEELIFACDKALTLPVKYKLSLLFLSLNTALEYTLNHSLGAKFQPAKSPVEITSDSVVSLEFEVPNVRPIGSLIATQTFSFAVIFKGLDSVGNGSSGLVTGMSSVAKAPTLYVP